MKFTRFETLPPYPFPRMRALLGDITPENTDVALNMSIGEPQHPVPPFVTDILETEKENYHKYPPVQGTADWQNAVSGWIARRNNIPVADHPVGAPIPLSGSREGLFAIGLLTIPRRKNNHIPLVLSPNPFYQPYAGAATAGGAEVLYVTGAPHYNQMPDYGAIPPENLHRTALAFLCNPSNPQGTLASRDYLMQMVLLARQYDFILVGDECYSEIYDTTPPVGLLDVCYQMARNGAGDPNNPFDHVVVFNSLSKRSNLAGLRSGFMAGDPTVMAEMVRLRQYGGSPLPLPVQTASAAAWNDETHVTDNRLLYRHKFDLAAACLEGKHDFYRPQGGFCLWLNVDDGEEVCRRLWQKAGIKVLPGAYLARPDATTGHNPGKPYIRLVLVHDDRRLEPALEKIARLL